MNEMLETTAAALRARGFDATVFSSAKEASGFIRRDLPAGAAVAIGGSVTVRQMGLDALLRQDGHPVFSHWDVPPEDRPALLHEAMHAPLYLCSANAVTQSGLIVQIDGTGNRVSAMCYGPQTVYVVVGRNKIVQGGYTQAVRRIKQVACPLNARRQGLSTPCAQEGGSCHAAQCPNSMCRMIVAFELCPIGRRIQVLLVDEDLGY